MLASELPTAAILVSPGVWIEPATRTRYILDPSDATLLFARAWSVAEVATANATQASLSANRTTLTDSLAASISTLRSDIGLAPGDLLLVKDDTSLNGILGATNATVNASPAAYIKALARFLKHTNKAIVASGKISTGALADTNMGQ